MEQPVSPVVIEDDEILSFFGREVHAAASTQPSEPSMQASPIDNGALPQFITTESSAHQPAAAKMLGVRVS